MGEVVKITQKPNTCEGLCLPPISLCTHPNVYTVTKNGSETIAEVLEDENYCC